MDLRRIRGPLAAAITTMLLAGAGSVALATNPSSPPASTGAAASEPTSTSADTDLLQVGDQTGDQSGAQDAAGAPDVAEADAGAPDTDNVQDESGAQN
jgi:hypothetical protein